mgnify:FL=1
MTRIGAAALTLLLALSMLVGCSLSVDISDAPNREYTESTVSIKTEQGSSAENPTASTELDPKSDTTATDGVLSGDNEQNGAHSDDIGAEFDFSALPPYSGEPYISVCGGDPDFSEDEITSVSYEYYSELDALGRCGVCIASVGQDIMPTEKRGSIGQVKPTGWHTVKYDFVDGKYLYNRCHLIGFQLTGENANKRNLITGTRYLNVEGMLPFENMVADYVKETGNHVMYRVTPIFVGDELLARGVHIEAESVEDGGDGIMFNVFCYNVQPGVVLDYATGEGTADS